MTGEKQHYREKSIDYKYVKFFTLLPLVLYIVEEAFIAVEDNAWRIVVFLYLILDVILFALQKKYKGNLLKATVVVVVSYWVSCSFSILYLVTVYKLSWLYVFVTAFCGIVFVAWRTKVILKYFKEREGSSTHS